MYSRTKTNKRSETGGKAGKAGKRSGNRRWAMGERKSITGNVELETQMRECVEA
jgi:hypothetical protein